MDIQLQELIETIKNEGIAEADKKSQEILAEAERKAAGIVENAETEADRLRAEARREIARNEEASRSALSQAGRDLILNLRSQIVQLFDSVVKASVEKGLQGPGLENSITALVKAWAEKGAGDIQVLLSDEELAEVEKNLLTRLGAELCQGVHLKPVSGIEAGFKIAEKDGAAYYDFTSQGLAEILSEYLNPRLGEILEQSVRGEE